LKNMATKEGRWLLLREFFYRVTNFCIWIKTL
jgi:hypothetical protein